MLKRKTLDSATGGATYIAAGTKIVGNLSGEGDLILCGRIEGEGNINGSLTIAAGSHWQGSIRATDIILAGSVEGDVTAEQSVEIAETAHVIGSLCARSIAVAPGAIIEGDLTITRAKERPTSRLDVRLNLSRTVS